MSAFHESIKLILADVNKFLCSTLKDENLSKSALKERTKILDSLQKLYEEYEVLNPNIEEGSSNSSRALSVSDEQRFTTGSSHSHGSEEDGSVDSIPYTTVKALAEPTKLGFLQKKPTDLLEKFSKQKKYCVIHKNIMYWFKKPADKKHQGAIFLTGYDYKDLSQADKEFTFELTSNKKKCYQFQADSKEDLEEWRKAVETGIKFVDQIKEIKEDIEEDGYSGEEYEPIDDVIQAVRNQRNAAISSSAAASAMTLPAPPKKLPPLPTTPEPVEEEFEPEYPEEEYSEGFSMPAVQTSRAQDNKKSAAVVFKPATAKTSASALPIPLDQDFIDDDDDMIYECVESPPLLPNANNKTSGDDAVPQPPRPAAPSSSTSSQEPPPLPSRGANIPQPPLPPLPISACTPPKSMQSPPTSPQAQGKFSPSLDANLKTLQSLEEDYENMFYGKFTCVGVSSDELNFNRGDIIQILSRDLDQQNWWIGESFGKVGLVPKEFLTPMYEVMVA